MAALRLAFLVVTSTMFALSAVLNPALAAGGWPKRTVKIVTPQPAGTTIDAGLRMLADRLGRAWGQAVVVENRPGGDGVVATTAFVQAHDDHTLLGSPGYPFTIAPALIEKLPYDPAADVTPIAIAFETPLMVAVHKDVPAADLAGLAALMRAHPGQLNWASTAGLPNLSFNAFLRLGKLDAAYVPYREVASAMTDLGEGRFQVYATSFGTVQPLVEAGKIRVIAMMTERRIPQAPNVPTVAEAGFPGMKVIGFSGLFGPKGIDASLVERIAADVKATLAQPEVQALLARNAQVGVGSSPAEFRRVLDEQRTMAAEILRLTGAAKR